MSSPAEPEAPVAVARSWPVRVKRPGERRSLSRSATRALDVLELFGDVRRPLRAIEVGRALDLHPSTANQLLKTMVGSAHLTFEAAGKTYLPSPRLARFSGWMAEIYGGDERLRGLIARVQAASGETVTLTTPNDLFMQVIDLVEPAASRNGAERGLRISMFGSATGAAYLASRSDAELLRLADRARIAPGEHPALLAAAARARRDGVADGPSPDGMVWSVAASLPATVSPAALVLGLAGPTARVQAGLPALRTLLRDAAADLARPTGGVHLEQPPNGR